jgi:hypothetical protein
MRQLSKLLGIDIDAEQLPLLAVLDKTQPIFHLHVLGFERAGQHSAPSESIVGLSDGSQWALTALSKNSSLVRNGANAVASLSAVIWD